MQNTVLLTLGRLPVALDIARSFAALGWRVIVAEPYGSHLCRLSRSVARSVTVTSPESEPARYLDDIAAVVVDERVQLVVPVSEETPRIASLKTRLPGGVAVFCDEDDRVLDLHDKYRFALLARQHGLCVAESWLPNAVPAEVTDVVVKPRYSCSGRNIRFGLSGEALRNDDVVQSRIDGDEFAGFGIAQDGRLTAAVVYRGTVLSGSVAVCFERVESQPAIIDWMQQFVRGTGTTGFIAFDFIVESSGRAVAIECNPRATSGIHFVAEAALARLILGETVEERSRYRSSARRTESWSCYTACLARLFRPRECREALKELVRAEDVTWSRRDPLPFLLMPFSTSRILLNAIRLRRTFAEVAVEDLEYRPDERVKE